MAECLAALETSVPQGVVETKKRARRGIKLTLCFIFAGCLKKHLFANIYTILILRCDDMSALLYALLQVAKKVARSEVLLSFFVNKG